MKTYGRLIICLTVALLTVACSTDGEDVKETSIPYSDMTTFVPTISQENSYEGIWTVNEVKGETADVADVNINVDNNEDQFGGASGSASFYGFPFQTITDLVMPGATISSIPNSVSIPMRYIGYSNNAYYLEFIPIYNSSMDPQCIFYHAILEDGKEIGITIHFLTEKSSIILNSGGETFSCIIPVDKIICSEGAGVVFKEIPFKPEMELRYTSIKRTKGSTVGN